ncbi:MAG: class I SAM-dependent methyltransferase [Acidimicrobiales bacterium]
MPDPAPAPPVRPLGLPPGIAYRAAGQDEAKYSTTNPVVRRLIDRLMRGLADQLTDHQGVLVDVGIGEGLAAERAFHSGIHVVGVEYRLDKVERAWERLPALAPVVADAGMLPFPDGSVPVTTCLEVLEHLVRPEAAVVELARVTQDRCVVSVPWEPWFRLGNLGRGKNLRRLGNDIEHIQAFTPRRLATLLGRHFDDVVVVRTLPWLIAVARQPRAKGSHGG